MKRVFVLSAVIAGSALNSLAGGQGTIRETDTQIYVEYSDEAVQNKPEVVQRQPETDIQQPQQPDEQKKAEEILLNQRRRLKYESRAAEWTEQRQEMERRQMETSGGVSEDE
ncbi:MAG TPA: hypothetical protein VGJ93_00970 [Desulfuromonadaceae bacterium]|jgi:hypothetical protein